MIDPILLVKTFFGWAIPTKWECEAHGPQTTGLSSNLLHPLCFLTPSLLPNYSLILSSHLTCSVTPRVCTYCLFQTSKEDRKERAGANRGRMGLRVGRGVWEISSLLLLGRADPLGRSLERFQINKKINHWLPQNWSVLRDIGFPFIKDANRGWTSWQGCCKGNWMAFILEIMSLELTPALKYKDNSTALMVYFVFGDPLSPFSL